MRPILELSTTDANAYRLNISSLNDVFAMSDLIVTISRSALRRLRRILISANLDDDHAMRPGWLAQEAKHMMGYDAHETNSRAAAPAAEAFYQAFDVGKHRESLYRPN
jgi:hypothetical protein